MAPNPRVAKAFRAMRDIGIPEEKTKPVLKNLLKLYEKNWELIEEENYRALADAIFDSEEAEIAEPKKNHDNDNAEAEAEEQKKKLEQAERLKAIEEETQIPEEPERPLKRLRLRHQDGSSSSANANGTPLKKPKLEIDDLPFAIPRSQSRAKNATAETVSVSPEPQARNKGKQPVITDTEPDETNVSGSDSGLRLRRLRDKGKEPVSSQTSSRELRSHSGRPSVGASYKGPKPKQTGGPLIKPKDEPIADDASPLPAPLSVIRPESVTNGDSSTENLSTEANNSISNVLASLNETAAHELAAVPDEPTTKLDIASSSDGEIKISLTCNSTQNPNVSVTNVDMLLKRMEDRCLKSYKTLDPNFSVKKLMTCMCDSLLDTDPEPDSTPPIVNGSVGNEVEGACENGVHDTEPPLTVNGSVGNEVNDASENGFQDIEPQSQLTADGTRSLHDINDIAKGQESVIISLVNTVNTECPPAFHYISGNAVFQNAYVNFSLARIGDDNCCSACFGDCLTSATGCACALQSGGEYAYTKEGLAKAELIDECIKMNRDPQKHCLFYCKECPLERSKNEEIVEPCKGHSVRSFIKECWLKCGCNKQCGNRVVQRGIQRKLQVFMTPGGKGWGLRTLEDLPKGAFVCEYVGEVLTNAELYERVSKSSNKDEHAYPVLLDADWGAESELKDEEALCLDATYYGNVARFINHRCFDSTLVEIPVEIENPDHHYYHLAFFTTRKVKAFEELTWDYGIDFDDEEHPVKAFKCRCGSRFCRNMKRPYRARKRRYN
ncbi:putative [histone H3]-lysine(4) N-trimethyltransferase chromatin remodeling SET family [Helianthus annuus]|uniref:Histone-lysine N-methyltransferase chromatin remodeling SET family n=1 Tax=Helianthus annuus TaxID=4232 RepID=A0A251S9M9_HELAN|nr:histone-lysine N-methyltransferase SUVR4 isoform X2 [Helianthus annuus]XP_035840029.1 histone-lysine N-methyltransferase SUVR4 isoform X2 [Helianthus annuus]XP_035840030.1 histone-lysine N-methyltransferase SUVR4 isoform X2 [Helianthus annuus]KAF5763112.1 putative histone-lysine N-methyltransferase chromatin remodeling SET family [Helianthus annuus]KAJ0450050.1 putative [histone H3]-lysine(4) N-trimethyltransferase chromatin remodeling SET family [Helianthus annuus]KAJ0471809.1 putative [hi